MKTSIYRLTMAAASFLVLFGITTTSSIALRPAGQFHLQAQTKLPQVAPTQIARSQLGRPLQVELGSKAVLIPDQLEIKVLSIQDSRCPRNIDCYWGGEALVKLNLRQAARNLGDLDLTLGIGSPDYPYPNNIKRVGKYYIRILAVTPYPDRNPKKEPQIVTLQVQKTPFKLKHANLP
jgi:hypothetical protein